MLRFLIARMEIWSPLSSVLPLTKPPDLLIRLLTKVMSSSERLGHPLASLPLSEWNQPDKHHLHLLCDDKEYACTMWPDLPKHESNSIITVLLLIYFSRSQLILVLFEVITILMIKDILSVLVAVSPMQQVSRVSSSLCFHHSNDHYQLCNWGVSSSIPGNTDHICGML